ncbi:NYN domain-containing protein [Massilia forsythiae]|uniref:NYN domain-containing protein n=1 Tax=Massilia forsythiae TaxID=2728020 RepID=A0A7Z2VYC6_9BURK|nr:NYN domain-containing protein [Massilia forsythiae]QJE01379.1 NYN domain-containing protein [Massilia forsythiae]
MASSSENISMAVFCDFENVALGVRDANYEKFDIKPVLERLLLKGSIVVKKAYCDWDRYKSFKGPMHEANFELIEIPHVRQSGKNSADIRMVVDALDLCYTKAHVDTFVIISGDSDFSPLVSKLRENAKKVIGVGVKQSTSDLLVANCDEFIFYDDLAREVRRAAAKRDERRAQPQQRRPSDEANRKREEMETRKLQALEMVVETFDALVSERGDTGKIWASLLKDTLKRRRPDFSETYYGFRTFGNLLEEAQTRGLFEFGRDEKSGTYVYRTSQAAEAMPGGVELEQAAAPGALDAEAADAAEQGADAAPAAVEAPVREARGRGRGRGRKGREQQAEQPSEASGAAAAPGARDDGVRADDAAVQAPGAWTAPTPDLAEAGPVEASPVASLIDAAAAAAAATMPDAGDGQPEAASRAVDAADQVPGAQQPPADVTPSPKERRRAPRAPRKTAARKDAGAQGADTAAAATPAAVTPPADAAGAPASASSSGDGAAAGAAEPEHQQDGAAATAAAVDTAAVETAAAGTAALGTDVAADAEPGEGEDAQADQAARKKSSRPAHKAPSRKPAARSRRPAKPKATPENG